jgi:hypothetical protein
MGQAWQAKVLSVCPSKTLLGESRVVAGVLSCQDLLLCQDPFNLP